MNVDQICNTVYVLTGVLPSSKNTIHIPRIQIHGREEYITIWDPELAFLVEYFRGLGIHVNDFTKIGFCA